MVNALVTLADDIELDLRVFRIVRWDSMDSLLNVFLIVFEIPMLGNSEYLELALHMLCKALSCLPIVAQAKLARVWAKHCKSRLPNLLQALQELITVKVRLPTLSIALILYASISKRLLNLFLIILKKFNTMLQVIGGSFTRDYCVQDADTITAPTKVMKILYYASMLAGELDPPELILGDEAESAGSDKTASRSAISGQIPQVSSLSIFSEKAQCIYYIAFLRQVK